MSNPTGIINPVMKLGKNFDRTLRMKMVVELKRSYPHMTDEEIEIYIGARKGTVRQDLRTLANELRKVAIHDYVLHRQFVLEEIQEKMEYCEDRMAKLADNPKSGSRWMEEWGKLVDKKIKILGLNSPEKMIVEVDESISKEDKDRVVDATLKSIGASVIDLHPIIKGKQDAEQFAVPE